MKRIVGHPHLSRDEKGFVHVKEVSRIDIQNARARKLKENDLEKKVADLEAIVARLLEEKK